jgi:hypothetical protein
MTLLFKTKKAIGFMMNRSIISISESTATSKKKGRKRNDTSVIVEKPLKPAVGGKRKRLTKVALDFDKEAEEDVELSVMEKANKTKRTRNPTSIAKNENRKPKTARQKLNCLSILAFC